MSLTGSVKCCPPDTPLTKTIKWSKEANSKLGTAWYSHGPNADNAFENRAEEHKAAYIYLTYQGLVDTAPYIIKVDYYYYFSGVGGSGAAIFGESAENGEPESDEDDFPDADPSNEEMLLAQDI